MIFELLYRIQSENAPVDYARKITNLTGVRNNKTMIELKASPSTQQNHCKFKRNSWKIKTI